MILRTHFALLAAYKKHYNSPTCCQTGLRAPRCATYRIGEGTVDLYFERHEEHTSFEITRNEARVEVVIPP